MTKPTRTSSQAHSLDAWSGLRIHLTLWLILIGVVAWMSREMLFPDRFLLFLLAEMILLVSVIGLWIPRLGSAAKLILHTASLGLLFMVAAEVVLTKSNMDVVALERYPYPYRTHGVIPNLEADTNRLSLTTNDTGLRHPEPIGRKAEGELRVLMVGGSSVLGVGDRDHETIPVFLEALLREQFPAGSLEGVSQIRVINGGQPWYTSTQELVFFVTELALYEPDVVVVLDGFNDAFHTMALGNRPPSNHVTSDVIENLLSSGQTYRDFTWHDGVRTFLNASYFRRRLRIPTGAIWGHGSDDYPVPEIRARESGNARRLSMQHRLVMNWTLWMRLGEGLGFRPAFALQPVIYSKSTWSSEEEEWLGRDRHREPIADLWEELQAFVRAEAVQNHLPLFDASRYVTASPEHAFLDSCHLNGRGNELVARAIGERIVEELADWPWSERWEGVRYGFDEGDPIWRPVNPAAQGTWR